MCPFKDYFIVYKKYDSHKMMMRNNALCKVIGIGNMKLKMHDGSFLELKQVRHVLDLIRYLISFGLMD